MPKKYAIHTKPTAHRFKAITSSGIIAWEEGCLKCAVCVKKRCVYKVYDQRNLDSRQMVDSIDNQCMNCLRCVQGCPKELIHKSSSPEFKSLGDRHWTPEIIARLWYQAETGKIPVSGAGYPGPFSGEGFDAMWTDMSEIVRPTRDGIHGREYISTGVDLGKTPRHLVFNEKGDLLSRLPEFIDIPVPVLMRMPSFGSISEQTMKGWAMAAKRLGTFLAAPARLLKKNLDPYRSHLMPALPAGPVKSGRGLKGFRLVELPWTEDWDERLKSVRKHVPLALVSVHLPMDKSAKQKALALARAGISIIHLEGSYWGTAVDDESTAMKDILRSVHRTLIEEGIRDEMTLLASGGIAMAEHVAKAMLCGADAVVIDFPILIALECRMCRRCVSGLSCPVEVEKATPVWVASRVYNLFGAFHNQLLEVMGAMGIRDARRLRGEVGRAMFFEELDKPVFGALGEVKEGYDLE
jgi:ferredoxin